ncbi:GNAT family N-acetyltransferase [Clostridium sp. AL.422]|uniref:GNAT family N-acetyltransferase n=1 Tax=Clostridium TaxID=1485 RepID=UPI00293DBA56|nr:MULTISPECIES: GNAT family N-acetyltransferase [unclassified Clostridium]MDV4152619.1 GNAT family N-acetyltransferase [Clostridium sp. AL.422]
MNYIKEDILSKEIILKKYLEEQDIQEIRNLEAICITEDNVNLKLELGYRRNIHRDYDNNTNDINEFLFYINNKLVGYLGISNFGGNVAEINGMVHPSYRRRGIFNNLVDLALLECKKRNFDTILLLCDDKSQSAIKFIENKNGVYSFSECRMKCNNSNLIQVNKIISLVKAKNENIDEINNLNSIFFGGSQKESIMPEDEEKNNIFTYLAYIDDKLLGKIKVSKNLNSAFISGFGILPEYRGNGYGRLALTKTLNNLNKDKIYDVELDVEIRNKKALNLYKDCGFIEQSIMNYYSINI